MLSTFRNRFGIPGVIAVIALVFAMLGGAYAANSSKSGGSLTGKQKKEVEKISKKFQGTGPQGSQGLPGANGAPGAKGATGPEGPEGPKGSEGKQGPIGKTGPTGTFGAEPLPSGESLTGVWGTSGGLGSGGIDYSMVAISTPILVNPAPTVIVQSFPGVTAGVETGDGAFTTVEPLEFEAACPGTAAEPEAAAGFLCVYQAEADEAFINAGVNSVWEAGNEFGVVIPFFVSAAEGYAKGTWAVTAPGP